MKKVISATNTPPISKLKEIASGQWQLVISEFGYKTRYDAAITKLTKKNLELSIDTYDVGLRIELKETSGTITGKYYRGNETSHRGTVEFESPNGNSFTLMPSATQAVVTWSFSKK